MMLRVGTRGSELALFQANAVSAQLRAKAGIECEIVVIRTSGDRLADASLTQIGGKRLFVKEIEDALLAGEVDLAVVARLGESPRIGTSSVRRTAQLSRLFPGATFRPIRGNLGTRLRKVDDGEHDAIVLASAGLIRLEHRARISSVLPVRACVPAPGQGIIAVEIREGDQRVARLDAERAVVTRLGGGCQMPIGAHAEVRSGSIALVAVVLSLDGARAIRAESRGPMTESRTIGLAAADELLAQGAEQILADAQQAHAAVEGIQP